MITELDSSSILEPENRVLPTIKEGHELGSTKAEKAQE